MSASFTGVGVGPGDPELITLKAARLMRQADVICYLCNARGQSQSRNIAAAILQHPARPQREIAIVMPMSEDRRQANALYDEAAATIQAALQNGHQVVFLCEGDPLFFGSFGYLLARLKGSHRCQVVPGIASMQAAAAALQRPLTKLTQSFAVVSGRHSEQQLTDALRQYDSVVIMKAGRARQKILRALHHSDRCGDARYLECIGRDNEYIEADMHQLSDQPGPYFSLFVITRAEAETG